jgi:N6-L-threonylcarbamoyladenine synthase
MLHSPDFDFSFAGLKTAVLRLVEKTKPLDNNMKAAIAREFEEAAVEVLVAKTMKAAAKFSPRSITIGGGVSANKKLRATLSKAVAREYPDIKVFLPEPVLSTDNGLMIAAAGCLRTYVPDSTQKPESITAHGNLRLDA